MNTCVTRMLPLVSAAMIATALPVAAQDAPRGGVTGFLSDWDATAETARAQQPSWSSPIATTTGLLEQRFRFDVEDQHAGNGAATTMLDGGKGLDLIVSDGNEIQLALAPLISAPAPPPVPAIPASAIGRFCG